MIIRYIIWVISVSVGCYILAFADSARYSALLFSIAIISININTLKNKVSKGAFIMALIVTLLLLTSAVLGWTKNINSNTDWEQFTYRPEVTAVCWLLLVFIGSMRLKKEIEKDNLQE